MTTDIAVVERALMVMAAAMAIQTLLFVGGAIGAFIAWRKASAALEETKATVNAQLAQLQLHVTRLSATADEVMGSVRRGTDAVGAVVSDVTDAVGTVRNSVGTVAAVVTAPRAALALGVVRGIKLWRKHRASQRLAAAAPSQL
jgi:hypothetical protein